MTSIKGEQSADRFVLLCEQCETEVQTEYLGQDLVGLRIKATCETCGDSETLKLTPTHWKGLPPEPYES